MNDCGDKMLKVAGLILMIVGLCRISNGRHGLIVASVGLGLLFA